MKRLITAGDYKGAIAHLQKTDQHDPFILVLLAQAYEKSGDRAEAMNYYRQALAINTHNPTNAFARPLAREKLGRARKTTSGSEVENPKD